MGIASKQYFRTLHFLYVRHNVKPQPNIPRRGLKFSLNLGLSKSTLIITLNSWTRKIEALEVFLIWSSFVFKTRKQNHHHPCIRIFLPIKTRFLAFYLLLIPLLLVIYSIQLLQSLYQWPRLTMAVNRPPSLLPSLPNLLSTILRPLNFYTNIVLLNT